MNGRRYAAEFNRLLPELSVFDIEETKDFYETLGFKIEYEREADKFMFEQIHDDGWNTGQLDYPLGRGVNFSIAAENVEELYKRARTKQMKIYRELTTTPT